MKIIAVATEYTGKTPREKVTAAEAVGTGINTNTGPFPDGNTVATAVTTAAGNLKTALDNYDAIPTDSNRDLAREKEVACDLKVDDCVNYVQSKVNAQSNPDIAMSWIHLAALEVKKKAVRNPKPDTVTDAGAGYSGISQTIMVTIGKKPKYAKYFEIWISLTPEVESSWTLKDTCGGKKLLVQGLSTGQKYYLRIVACNNTGKADPSEAYWAIAA